MAKKNYIEAFNSLARELAQHPAIELLSYHTFAPLSKQRIEDLERQYNCQLDDSIRNFYQQTNGVQLRWMLKSNRHYCAQKYPPFHSATAPMPWDYAVEEYEKEDGCVMLLPLEDILRNVLPPNLNQGNINLNGKNYSTIDFHARIRVMDCFSYYCSMALFLQENKAPVVLFGDENSTCFVDSKLTDFATYLEFVLASKAVCARRKLFFGQEQGYQKEYVSTLPPDISQQWSLSRLILAQEFPLADQQGCSTMRIKTQKMQEKAYKDGLLKREEWEKMVLEHQNFLSSGGIGGEWQLIAIRGRALGIYKGSYSKGGEQAILDLRLLEENIPLKQLYLPYSSWCGAYAKGQNFSYANLTGSLLTDANLEGVVFEGALLEQVDFSRSNLKGANFVNANLSGADFENCNLTEADFRGAVLEGCQFRGAVLKGIKR